MTGGDFSVWGFELHAEPENRDNGYITWVGQGREAWTLRSSGIGPNERVDVGQRLIPEEPMAMVSYHFHRVRGRLRHRVGRRKRGQRRK